MFFFTPWRLFHWTVYAELFLFYSFRGQSPLEAEFNLLETVRKVEMYGVWSFPAKARHFVDILHFVSFHSQYTYQL
jgi:hypothetical protein